MNESEFCLQERGKAYVSSLKESRWPLERVIGGASGSGLFVFLSVCIVHEPDAASVIVWGGPSDYKELSPDSSPLPPNLQRCPIVFRRGTLGLALKALFNNKCPLT